MIEMRWLTRGTQRFLQYRQKIDVTVRTGGAGTWDDVAIARTANMQWSEWRDVQEVTDGQ